MRTVRLGAVFGALCLLGSCIPVDDELPVSESKQLSELTGHEVVYLCDWALDYMGGPQSNPTEEPDGQIVFHRCPITPDQLSDPDNNEERYVAWNAGECPNLVIMLGKSGCGFTAGFFGDWVRVIADAPCEYHALNNGVCDLYWSGWTGEGQ